MNTSKPNFKDYSFAQNGEVYRLLEEVFSKHGIHYYLIGANARDVHLFKIGQRPTRMTYDIDFAVMVPDFDVYNTVFEELCDRGFERSEEAYRLFFEKTNTIIDLMPYGEIEQDYTVNFTERNILLSVLGFKEVGSKAKAFKVENFTIQVTPVEGIFILKLIAWNDKPEIRIKDLDDLSMLLEHAWELYEDDAYKEHLDLFEVVDFDQTVTAARIIGRKMRSILDQNKFLYTTIVDILKKSTAQKRRSENPEVHLAQNMDKTIEQIRRILNSILTGIED